MCSCGAAATRLKPNAILSSCKSVRFNESFRVISGTIEPMCICGTYAIHIGPADVLVRLFVPRIAAICPFAQESERIKGFFF